MFSRPASRPGRRPGRIPQVVVRKYSRSSAAAAFSLPPAVVHAQAPASAGPARTSLSLRMPVLGSCHYYYSASSTARHARPPTGGFSFQVLPLPPSGRRRFHATTGRSAVKPVLLADIGEGIVECEIIQWFVEPGARVEEFSPLCEVQSDKASVEITSRFAGVVKRLYYDAGEMAKVGQPFIDIDIVEDQSLLPAATNATPEVASSEHTTAAATASSEPTLSSEPLGEVGTTKTTPSPNDFPSTVPPGLDAELASPPARGAPESGARMVHGGDAAGAAAPTLPARQRGTHAGLATPAVRHLSKELDVDIMLIDGTGRDGRVLKEDIYHFVESRRINSSSSSSTSTPTPPTPAAPAPAYPQPSAGQVETRMPMTKTQEMMFKTMTRSLAIPHFLYADEINFTELARLRGRLNRVLAKQQPSPSSPADDGSDLPAAPARLSYLPFIIKAVSMALRKFPVLNARVEVDTPTPTGSAGEGSSSISNTAAGRPTIVLRSQHNVGVAMDTPQGLVVPVVRNVEALSVLAIAAELRRLQALALAGRLGPHDMAGGTITVSNIGSVGGTYVSPCIVERQVAILGVGRVRSVPAFADDDDESSSEGGGMDGARGGVRRMGRTTAAAHHGLLPGGRIVRREVCNFSWSADHRVVDGATLARAAEAVRAVVEEPDVMVMHLR